MGSKRLKAILRQKNKTVRECAEGSNVDHNKLYGAWELLTDEEKHRVHLWLVSEGLTHLSEEEVFESDPNNQYEFDTVYKSEAIARSRRRASHKR